MEQITCGTISVNTLGTPPVRQVNYAYDFQSSAFPTPAPDQTPSFHMKIGSLVPPGHALNTEGRRALLRTLGAGEDHELTASDSEDWLRSH